jgi:DNA-binding MarR family transcriptional regulator
MTDTSNAAHTTLLDEGKIEEYAERCLFGDKVESLAGHIRRKQALADSFRYSVLFLLYHYNRISRKRLVNETGRTSNGIQHHINDLLETNLMAEVPAPEDADGRRTYYRITTLGKQEMERDIENIVGGNTHKIRYNQFCDPSFLDGVDDDADRRLGPQIVAEPQADAFQDSQQRLRDRKDNFQHTESES